MATTPVKERPILFSGPMVRAILEGRKTQTRRVLKKPPPLSYRLWRCVAQWAEFENQEPPLGKWSVKSPYGQPDDRLWVRETFAIEHGVEGNQPPFKDGRPVKYRPETDFECYEPEWMQCHYRASDSAPDLCCERDGYAQRRENDYGPHWKPSIHMPRWASRILLEIVSVRVERLQDVSEADAQAEGIERLKSGRGFYDPTVSKGAVRLGHWFGTAKAAFECLWLDIDGSESWDANPWVWVIEFKRVEA